MLIKLLLLLKRSIFLHFVNGLSQLKAKSSRQLDKYYLSVEETPKKSEKSLLIFMVDGKMFHGGLADRLRAIVSIYEFSKKNNLNFKILHKYPFDLNDYLIPNNVNWRINEEDIHYNAKYSLPLYFESYGYLFEKRFHKKSLKYFLDGSYTQYHIYSNINTAENFSSSFDELFKVNNDLKIDIELHLKNINSNFVAIVLRFQQLLGDFKEGDYEVLDSQQQELLIGKCLKKIYEIKKKLIGDKKVLVASDSSKFLDKVKNIDFVYTVPGQVVHMDYTVNAGYEIYKKSFLDFFLIGNSCAIFLLKTDQMYKSGFAKQAAKLNNVPYNEIIF